jgi:hypothetical protein
MTLTLGNDLDVNSNKLLNVADGTDPTDGVNFAQLSGAGGGGLTFNQEPPSDPDTYVLYTVSGGSGVGASIAETVVNMTGAIPVTAKAVYAYVSLVSNGASAGTATLNIFPQNFGYTGFDIVTSFVGGTKTGESLFMFIQLNPANQSFRYLVNTSGVTGAYELSIYVLGYI